VAKHALIFTRSRAPAILGIVAYSCNSRYRKILQWRSVAPNKHCLWLFISWILILLLIHVKKKMFKMLSLRLATCRIWSSFVSCIFVLANSATVSVDTTLICYTFQSWAAPVLTETHPCICHSTLIVWCSWKGNGTRSTIVFFCGGFGPMLRGYTVLQCCTANFRQCP
jgi:hypothetical protein